MIFAKSKLILMALLNLLPFVPHFHQAGDISVVPATRLNADQQTFLSELIEITDTHTKEFANLLVDFFHPGNDAENKGLSYYTKRLDFLIGFCEQTLLKVKNEAANSTDEEYTAVLKQTAALMAFIKNKLKETLDAFNNSNLLGKKLAIGMALKKVKTKVAKQLPEVKQRVEKLEQDVAKLDKRIATQVAALRVDLQTSLITQLKSLDKTEKELLAAIGTRVKYA